jgi:uncharacterized membrane protein (DUF2068 family)
VPERPAAPPPRLGILRLIAVFKFAKALLVIATGMGLWSFYNPTFATALYRLMRRLPYAFEQRLLREALAFLSGMSPGRIQIIATATFAYSTLFLIEGVGLWRGRHWGEVLTVAATSSLVPIEVFEIIRHASLVKILVLVLNLAIVVYLLACLHRDRSRARLAPRGQTD